MLLYLIITTESGFFRERSSFVLFRGFFRKLAAAVLAAAALLPAGARAMPHMFQISVEAVPFQQDMTVYRNDTALYSGWGSGFEGALRYVSPAGVTIGLRGGALSSPYDGNPMSHYPVTATLGYRFQTGPLGIGVEAIGGYEFIHYDGRYSSSPAAGGRAYLEMPFGGTGFSLSAGAAVIWAQKSPVRANADLDYRISAPVTIGLTYGVPLGEKTAEESALPHPSVPFIGTVNIFGSGYPEPSIMAPEEPKPAIAEGSDAEGLVEEEAAEGLPHYAEAFFALPEGERVPEDILAALRDNRDGFRYSWSLRHMADGETIRDAWVSAADPVTGGKLERAVYPDEAAFLAGGAF